MKTFTDTKFEGYEFKCTSENANTGFKHVCVALKDGEEVEGTKSVINWGNRTWESYQYASVLENSKNRLQSILDGHVAPEIDYEFLNTLANEGYIFDFGELENGETVLLMDGWYQVEGKDEREYIEGQGMVKTGNFKKSVYAKLCDLAETGHLKPSVLSTIRNTEYVFTDQFRKCDDCGKVYDYTWGDLTWYEEEDMYLCDNCVNCPERVEGLIEQAKEKVSQAIKPTIKEEIIKELGYSLVTDEEFSFASSTWGESRWGCYNVQEDWVQDFMERYNGFVQISCVEQFDCPFQIWVSNEYLEEAQKEIKETFEE